jgi:hypothetical protein
VPDNNTRPNEPAHDPVAACVELHAMAMEQAHRFDRCEYQHHRACCVIRGPYESLHNVHVQIGPSFETSECHARKLVRECAVEREAA